MLTSMAVVVSLTPHRQLFLITGDITFKLRCNSFHAYKCPASVRLIFRKATGTIHLEVATGWSHAHEGELQTTKGLPPHIKEIIDSIVFSNPGIKCRALKNDQLWENHSVDKTLFDAQIDAPTTTVGRKRAASIFKNFKGGIARHT